MPGTYNDQCAAVVVGRGPAGLTAAIALAEGGSSTLLVGSRPAKPDNRSTALLADSVTALDTLGVWFLCHAEAAPLKVMRIVDDTGRLWRAPEVRFEASEIGLDAFGYNIENRYLIDAMEERARNLSGLQIVDGDVLAIKAERNEVTVPVKDGSTYRAPLVIGADGRNSICRSAAGVDMDERDYQQVALTLCVRHTRPHHDTSNEFHTPNGPFTLVPLPGDRSSLVWVLDPAAADELAALDDADLSAEIERASYSILGKIEAEPARGRFPLRVGTARRFADRRIALVGEAAHVIPPIGAQGLNLGLRDAATISELAILADRSHQDIGADEVLAHYDRLRRADVGSRTFAVDLLNRTLLSDFLPAQSMRGLGLYLIDRIGPLRRAVMREGVAPAAARPRLMRGETV
ncbi:MAG TPA: UbiH/UbiF family hydroxylase [Pseudolabrys sp.]|nr:UbiH/UbiF family hydroxylase [Pseudolabrys sp.]